jgi:hypothetical protein
MTNGPVSLLEAFDALRDIATTRLKAGWNVDYPAKLLGLAS